MTKYDEVLVSGIKGKCLSVWGKFSMPKIREAGRLTSACLASNPYKRYFWPLILTTTATFSSGASFAQSFTPPSGCKVVLSAALNTCEVQHEIRCNGPADRKEATIHLKGGKLRLESWRDRNNITTHTVFHDTGVVLRRTAAGSQNDSYAGLLKSNRGRRDYTLTAVDTGVATRIEADQRLTGETVTISGLELKVFDVAIRLTNMKTGSTKDTRSKMILEPRTRSNVYYLRQGYADVQRESYATAIALPGQRGFSALDGCGAAWQ